MQVRRELVVFQHSFQNWNFRGGFGCGDEFSGVWMLATEVHLLPPWCARVLFPLPQPGVCSRHDGHWETVTLCPKKKKKGWFLPLLCSVLPGCILSSWTSGRNRRDCAARPIACICRYGGLLPRTILALGLLRS